MQQNTGTNEKERYFHLLPIARLCNQQANPLHTEIGLAVSPTTGSSAMQTLYSSGIIVSPSKVRQDTIKISQAHEKSTIIWLTPHQHEWLVACLDDLTLP
eukprot:Lithocolla_globosa_v1_NODE_1154_length_2828_cov_50.161197.p5 type:complete len:100 gc:universal NODE_1154_length_2828_cov_50.161197:86-385(+)